MDVLSANDSLIAELYATKILSMCVLNVVLKGQADPKATASDILTTAMNSVDHFTLRNTPGDKAEIIKMAMQERIQQMVGACLNPGQG